ncbi:formylglycine-generating enzyme family protein [Actinopolymorpha alba]|uniref:formylglycine-generating enzyme family protein n=1 Tax=Actinopolymorpha alba TaxID=533267 RepID=UPI0003602143|nr:SUMF1/EgtB/PvdO family nonheme iron enzyme [Actinopolymorpha alba]
MTLPDVLAQIEDDLIEIPAGQTVVGSTPEIVRAEIAAPDLSGVHPAWLRKEIPRHVVSLEAFRIGRVPLTIAQVRALATETGIAPSLDGGPDDPATVGVEQTFALCAALSDLTGRPFRLPTEDEWVRAARGDDERTYPWGDEWEEGRANMGKASVGSTCPVGSFPSGRSAFGLLDLAGNADELTGTFYAPYEGAPEDVPERETWASSPYITKGGGYMHVRDLARCDRRHGIYAEGEPLAIRLVVG